MLLQRVNLSSGRLRENWLGIFDIIKTCMSKMKLETTLESHRFGAAACHDSSFLYISWILKKQITRVNILKDQPWDFILFVAISIVFYENMFSVVLFQKIFQLIHNQCKPHSCIYKDWSFKIFFKN